jgi:hypothetical protein
MLPSIHKAFPFVRASETPSTGMCAILAGSGRTTSYIKALMNAESAVHESEVDVNMEALKNFVLRFGGLAECAKDDIAVGNVYYMPHLPEFRVCEECHEQYIRPNASAGSQIALSFGEPVHISEGFVCQLYSERMRNYWFTAVANNNMDYLRHKVVARSARETETTMEITALKEQFAMLKQQAEDQEQLALMEQMMSQNSLNPAVKPGSRHDHPVRHIYCVSLFPQGRIVLRNYC